MIRLIIVLSLIVRVCGQGSAPKAANNPDIVQPAPTAINSKPKRVKNQQQDVVETSQVGAPTPNNIAQDEVVSQPTPPKSSASDNSEESTSAVNILTMFRDSLETQIEPAPTPAPVPASASVSQDKQSAQNTVPQPPLSANPPATIEPPPSTTPAPAPANPPASIKPPLSTAPASANSPASIEPPPSATPAPANPVTAPTTALESLSSATQTSVTRVSGGGGGGGGEEEEEAAVVNLQVLLQSGNVSAVADAPIVLQETAEIQGVEDPNAEIISGMPIRELQLMGNVSDILSGIAMEIDDFSKSVGQDADIYNSNFEHSGGAFYMNYDCNKLEGSLEGIVMMRDFNSMYFQGFGKGLKVNSEEECCEACKKTQGCNAWTYCNNPLGCGYGCQQVLDEYPRATLEDYLPVQGFGKFSGCGSDDRFPYRMCSLKSIDDWAEPQIMNGSEIEGYVSGFLEDPALVCGWNMSLRVCNQCVNSVDPYACVWCGSWEHLGSDEKEFCSVCATQQQEQTSQCLGCIGYYGTQRGCGSCVRSDNAEECLSCAAQNMDDENHQRRCYECSKSEDYMQECMDCIQDPNLSYPYKQLCKMCIRDDIGSPGSCMQCLRSAWDINHAQLCPKCAALDNFDDTICFNCLQQVMDPNIRHSCLECSTQTSPFYCQMCLQNSAIPYYAKDQCPKCTGESSDPERCMSCLQNSTIDSVMECTKCIKSSNETLCNSCINNVQDDSLKNLCYLCTESSDPEKCMLCIYDDSIPQHAKKYCANCMQSFNGRFNNACVQCLRDSGDDMEASGCSTCAQSTKNSTCFDCVSTNSKNKKTRDLMAQCSICYGTWATESCLSCMNTAKSQREVNLCRKCAFSSNPEICYQCLSDLKGNEEDMEVCLNCVTSTYSQSCSTCIQKQDDLFVKQMCQFCLNADDVEGCVNCLADPQVPEYAKYHCYLCQQNSIDGGVGREACEDCIRGLDPYEGYFCWNCCQQCGQQPICPQYMTFSAQSGVLPEPNYLKYDYE